MNNPASADPYDQPATWLERHGDWVWAVCVFALTVFLTVASFPPHNAPAMAFAFASPAIFWAYTRPSFRLFAGTIAAAQVVAWITILFWLRHVTWPGMLLLGAFVGLWVGTWYLAVWWAAPRVLGKPHLVRLTVQLGMAALWVVIEWSRTWFLGGFPWLPLAATQWKMISMLQIAPYTGAYGISFVLIVMNWGFAASAHRLLREEATGFNRRSQEFFLAMFLLLGCLCVMTRDNWRYRSYDAALGRVAVVQPAIPQDQKWDPAFSRTVVKVIEDRTAAVAATRPDLVIWPESVTPWPLKGDPTMKSFVESLCAQVRAPMIVGSDAIEKNPDGTERWYNAAFVVDPKAGVMPVYYAKRKRVPFGEYIPLHPLFGWLKKFVPIGEDTSEGTSSAPLLVNLHTGAQAAGILICYEDAFSTLARQSVAAGADFLAVITNDSWYGTEGAAEQHAAHSVLRAVETRRPVLRCGNNGWSGWIDEYGLIRHELSDGEGNVYVRGSGTWTVLHDRRWVGQLTPYVRFGDWFPLACAFLALLGFSVVRKGS